MSFITKYKEFEVKLKRFDTWFIPGNKMGLLIASLIFILAVHLFCSYMGIYQYIDRRPCSVHISAQTSRACVALNYYENDMNFFTPQYQRTMSGKGYTGMEFPIVYYLGAVMYKLFGFNEVYVRTISLLFTVTGLLFFFLLCLRYLKSYWISIAVIAAVCCSPAFIFYTPNFMPDPPSMAFILASWYFFFSYLKSHRTRDLNFFTFFVTLGVLLKISGGICYGVLIVLLLLDRMRFFKRENADMLFPDKKKIILRLAISISIVLSWYKYTNWFPASHGGVTFFMSPNMYESWSGLLEVLDWMKKLWLHHYYSYESYILMGVVAVLILLLVKFADRLLLSITILYLLGSLIYFIFFLNQFMHHDYYIITVLPTLFFLFLTFADIVLKLSNKYFYPIKFILILVFFFNLKESFWKCRLNYSERYSPEIYYWTGDYRAYEDLEPRLRKLGIKREDRVVSGFDITDCASLYLMNQLGSPFSDASEKKDVDSLVNHPNARYLILNDSALFHSKFGYDLKENIVLTHRGLIVYRLK